MHWSDRRRTATGRSARGDGQLGALAVARQPPPTCPRFEPASKDNRPPRFMTSSDSRVGCPGSGGQRHTGRPGECARRSEGHRYGGAHLSLPLRGARPVAGVGIHGQNGARAARAEASAAPDELSRVLPGVAIPGMAKACSTAHTPHRTRRRRQLPGGRLRRARQHPASSHPCDASKSIDAPSPKPRRAKGPGTVFLQAVVDFEGQQEPVYIGGPSELVSAAREAVSKWRAEPARINGAPLATGAAAGPVRSILTSATLSVIIGDPTVLMPRRGP